MSLNFYDLTKIRKLNIPASSLEDWMKIVTATDVKDTYWLMRSFIDAYGVAAFWAYKDQNMMNRYGKKLSDAEKIIYIDNMIADQDRYR